MLETVVQAQDRSRKPLEWVLEHLGLPSATYFRWRARGQRDELEDRIVVPPQTRKPLPEEEQAAKTFALAHTRDGYRRLAWMMVDENVVFLRPSAVYGVLNRHNLLCRYKPSEPSPGRKPPKPTRPNQVWHTDLMYLRIALNWYFLVSVLDGYSRYIVHHELVTTMQAWQVVDVMTVALETLGPDPVPKPRIVRDNGSQFVSKEWRDMISHFALAEMPTRVRHPQSNGRLERYHRSVREEGLADQDLRHLYHGRQVVADWVDFYNNVRLHSALNYLPPADYYRGDPQALLGERERKLQRAAQRRTVRWEEVLSKRR